MGVPDSGVPAAEGFARASGIPYGQGLVKNRYIGRTFIAPTQAERADGVRRKLNPLRENIAGKRLVVVDDSIVRGTTHAGPWSRMLREAGAAEVHLRISSPPLRWPCFYGIDTPDRDELLAADPAPSTRSPSSSDADSLAYLSLENLVEAIDAPGAGFCDACLTGDYPVPVRGVELGDTAGPARAGGSRGRDQGALPGVEHRRRRSAGGGHLRRRRGGHRRRRAGRRADPPDGGLDPRPEVLGGIGGFGGLFAARHRPLPTTRSWWPSTDGVGHQGWPWPGPPAATTPSASTWWPCASTTWSARGPSRSSCSTTSRPASVDPDQMADRGGRGGTRAAARPAARCSAARWPSTPGSCRPTSSTWPASPSAWSSADAMLGPDAGAARRRCSSGCPRPGCAPTATRWPATSCSSGPGSTLDDPAWAGADHTVADELLRPSVIYTPAVLAALAALAEASTPCAHITGGGIVGQPAPGPARGLRRGARPRRPGRCRGSSPRSAAWARSTTTRWPGSSTSASAWCWWSTRRADAALGALRGAGVEAVVVGGRPRVDRRGRAGRAGAGGPWSGRATGERPPPHRVRTLRAHLLAHSVKTG